MRILYTSMCVLLSVSNSLAQGVKISSTPGNPDSSSILELESTSKGLLPPRMSTSERNAIDTPASGLQIFNTTTNCLQFYVGGSWQDIACGCTAAPDAPVAIGGYAPTTSEFSFAWEMDPQATTYYLDLSTNSGFDSFVGEYHNKEVGRVSNYRLVGLAPGAAVHIRVRAANHCGTSPSSNAIEYSTACYSVGDTGPAGGIVFYVNGCNGLEASLSDQSSGAEWGCLGTGLPGANGSAVGTGAQNTIDIEAGCSTPGTAADICASLVLGGYSDWFLPSVDEFAQMYIHREAIGGFTEAQYWTSTESNPDMGWDSMYALSYQFINGTMSGDTKDILFRVRAIRAF